MRAVLSPLLGPELALERANNIAQVLVYSSRDAASIAAGMLRETGVDDLQRVARDVGQAWIAGLNDGEATEHAPAA